MRQGRKVLLQLTAVFIMTEFLFNYVMWRTGDANLLGGALKTSFFLLFIYFFSKRFIWAMWLLSISLVLYGFVCLLIGFELLPVFYFVGLFYMFFGILIHKSKALGEFRKERTETRPIDWRTESKGSETSKFDQLNSYPSVLIRYQAVFIDSILIMSTLIAIMIIVQNSALRTPIMVSSAFLILATYEPLLTFFSATVGQRIMKIRVRKHENSGEQITLLNAYTRWAVKVLLGWISLITINLNPERRAIHDLASNSIMVYDRKN